MAFTIAPIIKHQIKLRMALMGPSGSGKTWTALSFARSFGKVGCIDSERDGVAKYADLFPGMIGGTVKGDSVPEYIEAIRALEDAGVDAIVVDSLTHAWEACKDEVDRVAKRTKAQNTFAAWKEGTTLWGTLIRALLNCKCHLIVTARSKTEYVQEKTPEGKTIIRKVGMAPQLRDGMEYELDIVGEMDYDHNLVVTKSRCAAVADAVIAKPTVAFLEPVKAWLLSGDAATQDADDGRDWKAEARALYTSHPDRKQAHALWEKHTDDHKALAKALAESLKNQPTTTTKE